MSFLISPITINGTELCIGYGNSALLNPNRSWRTISVLKENITSLLGNENDDYWDMIPRSSYQLEQGVVEFGTSCGVESIKIEATFDRDPADSDLGTSYGLKVFLNGVLKGTLTTDLPGAGQTAVGTFECTPGPCGNIWKLETNIALGNPRSGAGPDTFVTAKILALNE